MWRRGECVEGGKSVEGFRVRTGRCKHMSGGKTRTTAISGTNASDEATHPCGLRFPETKLDRTETKRLPYTPCASLAESSLAV